MFEIFKYDHSNILSLWKVLSSSFLWCCLHFSTLQSEVWQSFPFFNILKTGCSLVVLTLALLLVKGCKNNCPFFQAPSYDSRAAERPSSPQVQGIHQPAASSRLLAHLGSLGTSEAAHLQTGQGLQFMHDNSNEYASRHELKTDVYLLVTLTRFARNSFGLRAVWLSSNWHGNWHIYFSRKYML